MTMSEAGSHYAKYIHIIQIIWRTSRIKNKQTNPGLLSKQIVEALDKNSHLLNQSEYHIFLSLLLNVLLITEEQNIWLYQADILSITSYRKTLALQFQLKISDSFIFWEKVHS